jgi:archaemetzincin
VTVALIAVTMAGRVEEEAAACAQAGLDELPGVSTGRIEPFPPPLYAYDAARKQYSSTLVLRDSIARLPSAAAKLLVLTEADIFIPMLSFVYGQAQLSGPVAVVSFARLRQEFYSLPPNQPLFLLRVRKEALHEIGHTFGLTHCHDALCTMTLSTNVQQLDFKRAAFCGDCSLLLSESVARLNGAPETAGA